MNRRVRPCCRSLSMTASSLSFGTFIFSPTISAALMAPCMSMAMRSSFFCFQSTAQALCETIICVFDSVTVSTMRRLLARSELPVSVMSTMASTKSGGLTSVAPQLNSTSAFTPLSFSQFFVPSTSSVEIRLPSKSLTLFMGESLGTARTQRTGVSCCLL